MKFVLITAREFLLVAIIFCHVYNCAQTAKGNWLLDGNTGNLEWNMNDYEYKRDNFKSRYSNTSWVFNLASGAGYFCTPNLVTGVNLAFNQNGTKRFDRYKDGGLRDLQKNSKATILIVPFLRFYFRNFNPKNRLYIQPGLGYGIDVAYYQEYKHVNPDGSSSKTTTVSLSPAVEQLGQLLIGYNYFFNSHIAFNTSLGYGYRRRTERISIKYTDAYVQQQESPLQITTTRRQILWNLGITFIVGRAVKSAVP